LGTAQFAEAAPTRCHSKEVATRAESEERRTVIHEGRDERPDLARWRPRGNTEMAFFFFFARALGERHSISRVMI
jgi:hypothetical protein